MKSLRITIYYSIILHLLFMLIFSIKFSYPEIPKQIEITITETKPIQKEMIDKRSDKIFGDRKPDFFKLSGNKRSEEGTKSSNKVIKRFRDTGDPLTDEKNIYSTFYQRVKQRLNEIWQDRARDAVIEYYKKYKKKMPNRITVVEITLDKNGYVLSCKIISESGDIKLDDIALEAFRSARIFPNPPDELITDGKLVFDWTFIIIL